MHVLSPWLRTLRPSCLYESGCVELNVDNGALNAFYSSREVAFDLVEVVRAVRGLGAGTVRNYWPSNIHGSPLLTGVSRSPDQLATHTNAEAVDLPPSNVSTQTCPRVLYVRI